MKKLMIIISLAILFSCSTVGDADYHLKEAMRKDSTIMVIQADTNNRYIIPQIQEKEPIYFYKDTAITDSIIVKAVLRQDTMTFNILHDQFGMYFW